MTWICLDLGGLCERPYVCVCGVFAVCVHGRDDVKNQVTRQSTNITSFDMKCFVVCFTIITITITINIDTNNGNTVRSTKQYHQVRTIHGTPESWCKKRKSRQSMRIPCST